MKTLLIISFFFCTSVFAGTSNKRNDLTQDNPTREDDLINAPEYKKALEECLENNNLPDCKKMLKNFLEEQHLLFLQQQQPHDGGSPNVQY